MNEFIQMAPHYLVDLSPFETSDRLNECPAARSTAIPLRGFVRRDEARLTSSPAQHREQFLPLSETERFGNAAPVTVTLAGDRRIVGQAERMHSDHARQ